MALRYPKSELASERALRALREVAARRGFRVDLRGAAGVLRVDVSPCDERCRGRITLPYVALLPFSDDLRYIADRLARRYPPLC